MTVCEAFSTVSGSQGAPQLGRGSGRGSLGGGFYRRQGSTVATSRMGTHIPDPSPISYVTLGKSVNFLSFGFITCKTEEIIVPNFKGVKRIK